MLTNPSLSQVTNGMHILDYMSSSRNNHFGCSAEFLIEHLCLLIWRSVLDGWMMLAGCSEGLISLEMFF